MFQAAVSGDFDAYSMFVNTIKYVHDFGVTFGLQLLGAIFFFVPRSIWPSKPVGSGALIAAKNGWLFTNVSCPLIGESYINFGLIGIIIFAIIYGIITSTLDNIYWSLNKVNLYNYWSLVYPVLLGMFFFHLRGDMLSSTAYTVGILVVGVITYYAMRLKLR
ncbi:MAG: O-antigen polysaccharide polymerase Wzy [Chitinophagaceae bacterium]|nr:MAG: O-antigen polysaccharide polymerase Wzy [Chitinophagaceae bacterium]